VQIWTCNGDAAQDWTVEPDGEFESGNGMCVGIDGGYSAPAQSKVWVWNCDSGGVQWLPDSGSGYPQHLTPGTLDICLGVNSSGDGANGTQLWINNCGSDSSQQWTLPYPVPTSTGEIQPQVASAVCIGLDTSSSTGAATLYGCDGDSNQTWTIEANGTIKAGSGDCLDVHDSGTSDGTEVDYAGCSSDAAQQWRVQADGSLLNPESGLCLEPSGGADTAGTPLVLEGCSYDYTSSGPTIQEWTLPAPSS
jgi:non-reducing end alpha-L-arabinofuranosidase